MQDAITEALRRGATAEAVETARTWVADAPGDADARRWLAIALAQSGDVEAALAEIQAAIDRAPDNAELHLVQGSLLLGQRQAGPARAALEKATELDPNQLPSYFLQAQVALARGDVAEAERLAKFAARIAPDHPHLAVVEAMIALRTGKPQVAVKLLGDPRLDAVEDPLRFFTLGFAHMQLGHAAFAEQSLRRVLELKPDAHGVRIMVSRLCQEQRRPDDALAVLEPLLAQPGPSFALQRLAGLLEMTAGRPARALRWLKPAFQANPRDVPVRQAAVQAWMQLDRAGEAGPLLQAAVAEHPGDSGLWMALSQFTPPDAQRALLDRWLAASPDNLDALEVLASMQDLDPDAGADAAITTTRRVLELDPTRVASSLRMAWLEMRADPPAAVARLRELLARHEHPGTRALVRARLGLALDRAGEHAEAVETWTTLRREMAATGTPLPAPTDMPGEWPPLAGVDDGTAKIGLLWGAPGSWVELLAEQAERSGLPLLADRFSQRPPRDPLHADTASRLVAGTLAGEAVVDGWREALPGRGVQGEALIDWLRWWDNGLLLALRPHLAGALLLFALRDPRDMLLDWIAFSAPVRPAFESPDASARWLAGVLDQVATLHEQNLYPHRIVRLDDALARPEALAQALDDALDTSLAGGQKARPALERLPAGHWRAYGDVLGEAFAHLHEVAQRLGYARD